MTRHLRPVIAGTMLILALAVAACQSGGMASRSDNDRDRSGASSDYGSPSMNDE